MKKYSQNVSCAVRIRQLRSKGVYGYNGSVFFQITIDRVTDRILLGMNWPVECFDADQEKLLPRFPNDELCYQYNMVLKNEMADVNRLKLEFYVAQKLITIDHFKRLVNNKSSRDSFLAFYDRKSAQMINDCLVNRNTGKIYNTTKARLKTFLKDKDWNFNSITVLDVQKFEGWLRNKYAFNSVVNTLTVLNKFFNEAKKEGIPFDNPMQDYKIPRYTAGNREALNIEELQLLKALWKQHNLTDHQQDVLERYLFSCHTGFRQSEIESFDTRLHYQNGVIKLNTIKGRRYDKKVNFKPPAFVNEIINGRRGRIFPPMASSLLNKTLKIIAGIAEINKYLKFHSGRDTFATMYLRLGGNLADLKDLLAHTTIATTEIYLKMNDEGKNDILSKFNDL
jgi:integrase/recombinase XerD